MEIKKNLLMPVIFLSIIIHSTFVQASTSYESYEEVTYDDLVNELNAKKRNLQNNRTSSFDSVKLHAGLGYATSYSNISAQKTNFNRHAMGVQLSLGMDLFSPHLYSEGVFKNYGITTIGSQEFSLREFDLKLGYRNLLEGVWSYNLSSGLSNRFLRLTDDTRSLNVESSTPSLIVSTGFMGQITPYISIGAEVSAHTAMVANTSDKNSFDFALRLNTSL